MDPFVKTVFEKNFRTKHIFVYVHMIDTKGDCLIACQGRALAVAARRLPLANPWQANPARKYNRGRRVSYA